MSDELSPEQIKAAQAWIADKRKNHSCPVCNKFNSLIIQAHFVSTPIFADGQVTIGGTTYPSVMLVCDNCGFLQLFRAVRMGLLK